MSIEDVEVAPPKAHEVRVKILWTGVHSALSHSDTDAYYLSSEYILLMSRSVIRMRILFRERTLKVPSPSSADTKAEGSSNLLARE